MSQGQLLSSMKVAVVGLGLMGGSLAMALRGKCARITGLDRDPETCAEAMQRAIVDQASYEANRIMPEANLIILALPVCAIQDFLTEIPSYHPGKAVIIDLGSTKARILEDMAELPEQFDPLGGHPMCGKEKSGLAYADPTIFMGAPFAFTPLPRTSPSTRALAEELAAAVGSHPLWLNAETHDRWVAATSHLPYLLSAALAASLLAEAAPLIGPGYRSASRLAGSSPEMMIDILKTNRENILGAMEGYRNRLAQVEELLRQEEYPLLMNYLSTAQHRQAALLEAQEQGAMPCN